MKCCVNLKVIKSPNKITKGEHYCKGTCGARLLAYKEKDVSRIFKNQDGLPLESLKVTLGARGDKHPGRVLAGLNRADSYHFGTELSEEGSIIPKVV